ncbi:hypothetical protein DM02DRAFT_315096 [Periconia macrospinosa]|uniref:NAD(P)-binding protein n=1 Tax=Periconia macrospinosa TaxID=97972 RepID=A0A2V1D2T6_9PLEO|nr:hypothetical protein DM02DRAFT_315096 [Periconia macrospinosa]
MTTTFTPCQPPTLPPGSLILIAGISGYKGTHIVHEAFVAGYRIRGTCRTPCQSSITIATLRNDLNYSTAITPDFAGLGAFDAAIQDCAVAIHATSDLSFAADPHRVMTPVVARTRSIIASAARCGSVKQFFLISPWCAVCMPSLIEPVEVRKHDWNLEAVKRPWEPASYTDDRAAWVYTASKTESEIAMW